MRTPRVRATACVRCERQGPCLRRNARPPREFDGSRELLRRSPQYESLEPESVRRRRSRIVASSRVLGRSNSATELRRLHEGTLRASDPTAVVQRDESIFAASEKSRSVMPSASCVESQTSTRLYTFFQSG